MDTLDRPDVNLYSRIISNDAHQARVLAERAITQPSALQWWHQASNEQRKTLATYCPEYARLLMGGKRG